MKLTWEDFEAHRSAATPRQWRRMEAYFRDGKSIMEIAADEGKVEAKTSLVLGLGRGCIAVLNSMLQRPVRIPTERKTLVSELQELLKQQAGEVVTSSGVHIGETATSVKTFDVSHEITSGQGGLVPQEDHSLPDASECAAIALGMRVQGSNGADHDAGRVLDIDGDTAVVAWDSGFQASTPVANLTPFRP